MDSQKAPLVERLRSANNVLVTVRSNPTVDLLSACIALTLALDKLDKHATAVFSGQVPSTIEFLKPEETIERTPNSLRDFIIALDKSKADKLRYKVEDKVVRIFITPYKTSLSEKDLEFSQGDFNVDAIVALGAHSQEELDQAITTHGRILHDAAVVCINNTANGNLGSINWQDTSASSISELVTQLVKDLGKDKPLLDEQIATALLTGIVAETERFSNEKTTPKAMSLAGDLMSAGANQQLVADKLEEAERPKPIPQDGAAESQGGAKLKEAPPSQEKRDDGTLEIPHEELPQEQPKEQAAKLDEKPPALPAEAPEEAELPKMMQDRKMLPTPELPQISQVHGSPLNESPYGGEFRDEDDTQPVSRSYLVDQPAMPAVTPPSANGAEPSRANPFDVPPSEPTGPMIDHDSPGVDNTLPPSPPPLGVVQPTNAAPMTSPMPTQIIAPTTPLASDTPNPLPPPLPSTPNPSPSPPPVPPSASRADVKEDETLEELEEAVHSPHLSPKPDSGDLDAARSAVLDALHQGPQPLEPLQSLNSSPFGADLHSSSVPSTPPSSVPDPSIHIDAEGNIMNGSPAAAPKNEAAPNPESPANQPLTMPLPPVSSIPSASPAAPANPQPASSTPPPPPVPPPMMPPGFGGS